MGTPAWSYEQINTHQIGRSVDLANWAKGAVSRRQTETFSAKLAEALHQQGVNLYAKPQGKTLKIGLCTGMIDQDEGAYRNSPLVPSMMAKQRQGVINDLTLYRDNNRLGQFLRYGVVTAGGRVRIQDLRNTIEDLVERVRRWKSDVARKLGVEVLMRSIEFPYDPVRQSFHVHCNLIYAPCRRLNEAEWVLFLERSHKHFGTRWQDAGRIKDIREAVKYCLKGEDLRAILEQGGDLLAQWFHQIAGKRLIGTYKALQDWRSEVRQKRLKPYSLALQDGSSRLIFAQRPKPSDQAEPNDNPPARNQIVAVTLPQASFTPFKEPVAIIRNADLSKLHLDKNFADLRDKARATWKANGAPDAESAARLSFNLVNSTLTSEIENSHERNTANQARTQVSKRDHSRDDRQPGAQTVPSRTSIDPLPRDSGQKVPRAGNGGHDGTETQGADGHECQPGSHGRAAQRHDGNRRSAFEGSAYAVARGEG